MVVLEIEACKPPRNDLKFVSVIEMTFLYGWYSCVLLRPKSEVKLSTQTADKWICMRKCPVPGGAIYFPYVVEVRLIPEFVFPTRTVS